MRNEGLDPEGKIELAGLLMQIGFKVEALTEYLMAAQMYEERGQIELAIKLYDKVLSIDESNQAAKRGLQKLKEPSGGDIDEIVKKMGFAPTQSVESESSEEALHESDAIPELQTTSNNKIADDEFVDSRTEVEPEVEYSVKADLDLSSISVEEFLASIDPMIAKTPDNIMKRSELAMVFKDEGLWEDAFYEFKAIYSENPSVEKLHELLSILAHVEDRELMSSFLLTESFKEYEKPLKQAVLEALINVYEDLGKHDEASNVRSRLHQLTGKKPGTKMIDDLPSSSAKQEKDGEEKSSGHIHFI
jgi:tetratricopeptide (TPR) repeat protein